MFQHHFTRPVGRNVATFQVAGFVGTNFLFAINYTDPQSEYYSIFSELIPTNSAIPLRATAGRIEFLAEESIGPKNQLYRDDGGGSRLTLSIFDNARVGLEDWQYFDVGAKAPKNTLYYHARSLTEVFVGYRVSADDGNHFGWLKFARSDLSFTNVFDLVADDWHPIPGAAIGAGLPPEIPLTTTVTDDGAGGFVLQVGWHPALSNWSFETTGDLTPPVTWTEYPAGGASAEIPLDGSEDHRYFRLRRP